MGQTRGLSSRRFNFRLIHGQREEEKSGNTQVLSQAAKALPRSPRYVKRSNLPVDGGTVDAEEDLEGTRRAADGVDQRRTGSSRAVRAGITS